MKKSLFTRGSSERFIILCGIILTMAIIGIAIVAFGEAKGSVPVATYAAADREKPHVIVGKNTEDFGGMTVSDEKTTEFALGNTGNKPLEVYGITTSCGCTFAEVEINGTKSPQFSMHAKSDWVGVVPKGSKAIMRVTYKPSIMPVKGEVTRAVFVKTNDPENPELTFLVKANVK